MKGRGKLAVKALGVALALSFGAATPQPAAAQGLFDVLFGGFGNSRPAPRVNAPAYAPSDYSRDRYQGPRITLAPRGERAERSAPSGEVRGYGTHCVRLCDGRYFPLPRTVNGARLDPAKVCSALCPAATTQVFHGSNMQYAVAGNGKRYADLDTAFAFREKIVPDCSCTGQGPGGLAQIDVESDPTLRAGDIVVTTTGPAIFRGSKQFPHQAADFTPVDDYGRLNAQLRQKLSELQVNADAIPVVPPQKLANATGTEEAPARKRVRRAAPAQASAQAQPRGFFGLW